MSAKRRVEAVARRLCPAVRDDGETPESLMARLGMTDSTTPSLESRLADGGPRVLLDGSQDSDLGPNGPSEAADVAPATAVEPTAAPPAVPQSPAAPSSAAKPPETPARGDRSRWGRPSFSPPPPRLSRFRRNG